MKDRSDIANAIDTIVDSYNESWHTLKDYQIWNNIQDVLFSGFDHTQRQEIMSNVYRKCEVIKTLFK